MITYELEVTAVCPVDARCTDVYQVVIESDRLIQVERILEFFRPYQKHKVFQEDLTRKAAAALGARVMLVGVHSGVTVTSIAP